MIDHFALALGHGLLAVAMWRLMMRRGLDEDPLLGAIAAEGEEARRHTSTSGRNAARRARTKGDVAPPDDRR
jgi:hypothetical protein